MEESCAEKKKNVVRCTGATSFNSSLLGNSTQVTIALLNGIQTAWENSSSFLVKGSGKPPFFPLPVIPTGGSPFSFLGLSSTIYNPSSEEPTPLCRARRGGPVVLLQPSMRSAGPRRSSRPRGARGRPKPGSRRFPAPRTKLPGEERGSPAAPQRRGPAAGPREPRGRLRRAGRSRVPAGRARLRPPPPPRPWRPVRGRG